MSADIGVDYTQLMQNKRFPLYLLLLPLLLSMSGVERIDCNSRGECSLAEMLTVKFRED